MGLGPSDAEPGDDRGFGALEPGTGEGWGALERAGRIGLDLETDGFHAYREQACLVQLSSEDGEWLYDPLAHGLDPALRREIAREDRDVVGHALENDVRILVRDHDLRPGRLFDTAAAARLDPEPLPLGLKDLLEAVLGVKIDKGEQRSDWSKRPLTDRQLAYARQDVRYLLPLADALAERLEASGRTAWHAEECERLRTLEPVDKPVDPEAWRKLSAAKKVGKRGRAVLAELWAWRERKAEGANRAPFRVMAPELLGSLARDADTRGAGLVRELGRKRLPPSIDPSELGAVIEAGLERPDPGRQRRPGVPQEPRTPLDEADKTRLDRLREGRASWAARLGIDAGFLLSNAVLERIVRVAPSSPSDLARVEGVGAWRSDVLHAEILGALRL